MPVPRALWWCRRGPPAGCVSASPPCNCTSPCPLHVGAALGGAGGFGARVSPPNPCPSLLQRRGVVGLPESTAEQPHLLLVGVPAEHHPGRHKLGLGHDLRTLSCCPSLGPCWSHRGAAAPSSTAGPWGPRAARRWGALVWGCAHPQNQFCPLHPTPITSLSWVSLGPALSCCPRGGNEPAGSSCCLLSPLLHRGAWGGGVDRRTDGRTGGCCLLLPQQGWEGARGHRGVPGVPLPPGVSTAPTSARRSPGSPRGPGGGSGGGIGADILACGCAHGGVHECAWG